jgi:hypothetical protein
MAGYCAKQEERPGGRDRQPCVGKGARSEGAVDPDCHRADDDHPGGVRVELWDGVAPRPACDQWQGRVSSLISHFRLIILSWGLERSFGDKLAITFSRNFVSVCNFMQLTTSTYAMVHFLTLSHTFATLWESYTHFGKCEKV